MNSNILFWLVIYQLKHFLADYPLQTPYMLGKFKSGWEYLLPLLSHVFIHANFTLIICLIINPTFWWLSLVDLCAHFIMDRIKASPNILGRFKPDNKYFWWSLGFDQMVHHLTHYFILFMLLKNV